MDKISVIVPVYNVEEYLERCVRSICNQTYSNLEILLVDDGSTDNSGKLCDTLSRQDSRIRVLHKANGGLSDARNVGMDAAAGQYIAFVDSDDWIDPYMLELLHNLCVTYGAEISECSYRNIYADYVREETLCSGQILEATPVEAIAGNLNWKCFKPVAWNKLYRADIAEGIRYPVGRLHEDEFTTHKFYLAAQKIVYADISAYNYDHKREDSITASFRLNNLDSCQAFHEKVHLVWERPELAALDKKMCSVYCYTLFTSLSKCVANDLHGEKVEQTIQIALQDRPELERHGIDEIYQRCLGELEQNGLNACVRMWDAAQNGA